MTQHTTKYTLICTGDIEQAVLAVHERQLEATIIKALYDEGGHQTLLVVQTTTHQRDQAKTCRQLEEKLEQWKAERGTTGMLLHYGTW